MMAATGLQSRCRIVTRHHDGTETIGSWVGNPEEAREQISLEAAVHGANGWDIQIVVTGDGKVLQLLLTSETGRTRRMWIDYFTPLDDKPPSDPDVPVERHRRRGRR